MRGCFVTGTGTGVGKTVVAAAITAALRARGERVAVLKPVLTGLDEPADPRWPPDHELLGAVAGLDPDAVAPWRFGQPVSPHLAAQLAGGRLDPAELVGAVRRAAHDADAVVVEGVGGLLVPFTPGYSVRDLASELGLPVIVAASPGLGTINHTLLTVEAARSARLDVRAVVLTPWPAKPGAIELSNRETIAALGGVDVDVLPLLSSPRIAELERAGAALVPWRWVGETRLAGERAAA